MIKMTKWIKKVKISIEKSGYIIKMNKFWKKWTKKDWQGWQSESASIAWFDWIWFLVTTVLNLPGQVWKIDDVWRIFFGNEIFFFFWKRLTRNCGRKNGRFFKMGREIIFIMGDFFRMGDFEKWEIFQNEIFWEMRDFEKLWKEKKKKKK